MRQRTVGLLLLLLLVPKLAFASGNDIFVFFFVLLGHVVVLFGGPLALPLPWAEKAVLAGVYLLALVAACVGTGWLSYTQNLLFINWTVALAPALATVAVWWLRRTSRKKQKG